jgi:hypothetical protein
MGIWDRPTAPRSSWQNGRAERLISSIRRECLDHVVVLGAAHLRRILASQLLQRTQNPRSLTKDTPPHRAVSWLELAQWDAQINLQLAQILAARSALGLGFDFVLEVQLDAEG